MNFIERQGNQAIRINGFEEVAVASAAVQALMGEDHPLLTPGNRTYGNSLTDELRHASKPNAEPEPIFRGYARDIIVGGLRLVADEKSGSEHQRKAAMMLNPTAYQPEQAVVLTRPRPVLPRVRSHVEPSRSISKRRGPLWIRRQVALCGFGDMIAAQHAVAEFIGEDSALLEKGRVDKNGHPSLIDAIDTVSSDAHDVWVFDGKDGRIILWALKRAAARNETVFDAAAVLVLKR